MIYEAFLYYQIFAMVQIYEYRPCYFKGILFSLRSQGRWINKLFCPTLGQIQIYDRHEQEGSVFGSRKSLFERT